MTQSNVLFPRPISITFMMLLCLLARTERCFGQTTTEINLSFIPIDHYTDPTELAGEFMHSCPDHSLSIRDCVLLMISNDQDLLQSNFQSINNLTCPNAPQPLASAADLESLAAAAVADASTKGLPWMFGLPETHLPETTLEEANAILAGVGLQHMMYMTVMECEGDLLEPARPLPEAGIEYRRVRTQQEAFDALDLNSKAYGMPEEVTRDVVDAGTYFSDPERDFGIVAYDTTTGEPVSTATVIRDLNGWNYVAAVATNSAHRQKGYAEAAIRKALHEAGATGRTSLDASRMGQPLYAQMGYQARHRWNFWISAEASH